MPSLTEQLNTLLSEVKQDKLVKKVQAQDAAKPKREVPGRMPDSIVLIEFESRCLKCGTVHKSVNKRLLLRYNGDLMRPKKWIYAYSAVPREILLRAETVEACIECFETGAFPLYDIEKRKE